MANNTTVKFSGDLKGVNTSEQPKQVVNVKQVKVFDVANVLYTESVNLPAVLSRGTILVTTDTREMFIGTGTGIKRMNIGSDGEVIDKTDFITKEEALRLFVYRDDFNPFDMARKTEVNNQYDSLSQRVQDIEDWIVEDNVSDRVYTKNDADATFLSQDNATDLLSGKVDIKQKTDSGNVYVNNTDGSVSLLYEDIVRNSNNAVQVQRDNIVLSVLNSLNKGPRIILSGNKAYYTKDLNVNSVTDQDELQTKAEFDTLAQDLDAVERTAERAKSTAQEAVITARNANSFAQSAQDSAELAYTTAQEAASSALEAYRNAESVEESFAKTINDMNEAKQLVSMINTRVDDLNADMDRFLQAFDYYQGVNDARVQALQASVRSLDRRVTILEGGDVSTDPVVTFTTISNVTNPSPLSVEERTTFNMLGLPEKVTVTLSNGFFKSMEVFWMRGDYSMTEVGKPQVVHGDFVLPEDGTITNPNGLQAQITVTIQGEVVVETKPNIVTVTDPTAITVDEGVTWDELNLPMTVSVTLSDSTTTVLPVTWNEEDFDAVLYDEEQSITGVLSVPATITNTDNLVPIIKVTIQSAIIPDYEITGTVPVPLITVQQGATLDDLSLPAVVTCNLSNGTTIELAVTWQAPDMEHYDVIQSVSGDITLIDHILNSGNYHAKATIKIESNQTDGYAWLEYLLVPENVKDISNFSTLLGHPFYIEELYGPELDGKNAKIEIRFIGNTVEGPMIPTTYDSIEELTFTAVTTDKWIDGIRMPNEADTYIESEVINKITDTNQVLASGVSYEYNAEKDSLTFMAGSVNSKAVYLIRKKNSFLPVFAEGDQEVS